MDRVLQRREWIILNSLELKFPKARKFLGPWTKEGVEFGGREERRVTQVTIRAILKSLRFSSYKNAYCKNCHWLMKISTNNPTGTLKNSPHIVLSDIIFKGLWVFIKKSFHRNTQEHTNLMYVKKASTFLKMSRGDISKLKDCG